MIQSLTVENYLSFKNEKTFSFEATKDKHLEDHLVVEVVPGVRLLKLGIVYGANASGKSNLIEAFDFLKEIWFTTPDSKEDEIEVTPFLFDDKTKSQPSKFKLSFFVNSIRYVYTLEISSKFILLEKLDYYPSIQPANIFERKLNNGVSIITFGPKTKIKPIAKNEIAIKCLSNMSFFAAYNQVNEDVKEIESALDWMRNRFMDVIEPDMHISLSRYVENLIKNDDEIKESILSFLKEADFNISDIYTEIVKEEVPDFIISSIIENSNISAKEKERIKKEKTFDVPKTEFEHKVYDNSGNVHYYKLPKDKQSEGTIRSFELSGPIIQTIRKDAFLCIDEIESKLHPRLIEFIIEKFINDSNQAQLLVTTHYDGLLDEEDLLRKDCIWFTEKDNSGSTDLYSLADIKAVNRISSWHKAYKYGKFGAIPNI